MAHVKTCCVLNCSDQTSKRHRFPHKDPDTYNTWIANANNPKLVNLTPDKVYNSYFECDKHFKNEFKVPGTKRGLQKFAVPTLHLNYETHSIAVEVQQMSGCLIKVLQDDVVNSISMDESQINSKYIDRLQDVIHVGAGNVTDNQQIAAIAEF